MFRKLLCPMSRHWRTLDYVLLCFLILSAASSCWCIVKIAAGGKSSGSGRSQGGSLVRIMFWPIFLDEQLVPGRSWALCSHGTEEHCSAPLLEVRCVWGARHSVGKVPLLDCAEPGARPQEPRVREREEGGSSWAGKEVHRVTHFDIC